MCDLNGICFDKNGTKKLVTNSCRIEGASKDLDERAKKKEGLFLLTPAKTLIFHAIRLMDACLKTLLDVFLIPI